MGMVGFGLVLRRTSKFIVPLLSYCGDSLQVWHHDEAIFRSILVLVRSPVILRYKFLVSFGCAVFSFLDVKALFFTIRDKVRGG
jgi:hypothetical protein